MDEAARITGIDRITLRQKNLIAKEDFPYKTPTGSTYDSGDPPGLLQQVLEAADWNGFERRREAAKADGKLRGIGCAVFIEPSGGVGQEEIAIRFDAEGSLDLFTLSGASGQGHETVFPELVADILGIAVRQGDAARQRPRCATPGGHRQLRLALAHVSRRGAGDRRARDDPQGHRARGQRARSRRERPRVRARTLSRVRHRPLHQLCRPRGEAERQRRASAQHHHQDQHRGGVSERLACLRGRDRSGHRRARAHPLRGGRRLPARSTIT